MANTKSAQKALRQNKKHRVTNVARKSAIKTSIKRVHEAVLKGQTAEQISKLVALAAGELARAKSKAVIHANNASRRLSRLMKHVNKHTASV